MNAFVLFAASGLAVISAGCSKSDAPADAGLSVASSQRPMPTGMLMPGPTGMIAPGAANASANAEPSRPPSPARLRVTLHEKAGAFTELQVAPNGDPPTRLVFDHWREDSHFVSLDAMTLLTPAFAAALPGFDLFMPRLFDPKALGRLDTELGIFAQTWSAVPTAAAAKAKWALYSDHVRSLQTDAQWLASRDALTKTIDELVGIARSIGGSGHSLWVLGP